MGIDDRKELTKSRRRAFSNTIVKSIIQTVEGDSKKLQLVEGKEKVALARSNKRRRRRSECFCQCTPLAYLPVVFPSVFFIYSRTLSSSKGFSFAPRLRFRRSFSREDNQRVSANRSPLIRTTHGSRFTILTNKTQTVLYRARCCASKLSRLVLSSKKINHISQLHFCFIIFTFLITTFLIRVLRISYKFSAQNSAYLGDLK